MSDHPLVQIVMFTFAAVMVTWVVSIVHNWWAYRQDRIDMWSDLISEDDKDQLT